ncbi:conserved hypothetical protein [Frankia canadensis]|uniref:Uncharacterized protein n=1 Tax=Frankia canadensis TaxID=1836972 RepID=A0A2I2L2D8_9ACTN|nr:conserved hypothetical protein [Frankia canadensis]SOU59386.1 conserved hypothetical protein [Frankia canadensis]
MSVRDDERMKSGESAGRYRPLAPTAPGKHPEQARWADAMKAAMERSRINGTELTVRVAGELGLSAGSDRIRRWLANDTRVDPVAIPVLARAVGAHPLEMLAAHGLIDTAMSSVALRLSACEQRFRRQRALLAEQHRVSGGALFAESALRDGRWAVTVLPHWRGRRCHYHFADYVFLARLGGVVDRDEASQVFEEAFRRTGAEWDDGPFHGDALLAAGGNQARVYVPRLPAACAPESFARSLPGCRGVVIAGPRWAGMYTVAALVSVALGWGRESFEFLARSLSPGGAGSVTLANELLRGWLGAVDEAPHLVWAHILTDPGVDGTDPALWADVRLLVDAPADVQVVLLVPEDADEPDRPGDGDSGGDAAEGGRRGSGQRAAGGALGVAAELAGTTVERLRRVVRWWMAALPQRPGVAHVLVPTPRSSQGQPVGPSDDGFLDAYFDSAVDVALGVLTLLADGAPVRTLVPAPAAASDPFAALAAQTS